MHKAYSHSCHHHVMQNIQTCASFIVAYFSHLTSDLVISFIQFSASDYHHVKIIFKNMPKYQPCHQNSACIVLLLYEIKIGSKITSICLLACTSSTIHVIKIQHGVKMDTLEWKEILMPRKFYVVYIIITMESSYPTA